MPFAVPRAARSRVFAFLKMPHCAVLWLKRLKRRIFARKSSENKNTKFVSLLDIFETKDLIPTKNSKNGLYANDCLHISRFLMKLLKFDGIKIRIVKLDFKRDDLSAKGLDRCIVSKADALVRMVSENLNGSVCFVAAF